MLRDDFCAYYDAEDQQFHDAGRAQANSMKVRGF
jgi:hypothetical protein